MISFNVKQKRILAIIFGVIFISFVSINTSHGADLKVGGPCENLGQPAQVCTGERDYTVFGCAKASEDNCQGLYERSEKLNDKCYKEKNELYGKLLEQGLGYEAEIRAQEFDD